MLRLIFLLPTLVVVLPLPAVVVGLLLVFKGSPGECGGSRDLLIDAGLAQAYQQRWVDFQSQLALGQPATLVVNDSEATSRARAFLNDADAPVDDFRLCLVPGGADTNAKISTPFGPDVAVRVKGGADLAGQHPRARVDSIKIGAMPSFVTRPFRGLVTRIIDDQMERIFLDHRLTLEVRDGEVLIHGEP